MSSRHDKKYDTDEFEAQMNKEQLLNIYKSFDDDSFYVDYRKKKEKKPKAEKKKVKIKAENKFGFDFDKTDNKENIIADDEKVKKDAEKPTKGFLTDKKLNQSSSKHKQHKSDIKSDIRFSTPNIEEIEEQDESVPITYVVTKESPAIKVYAILAVAICFLIIGGLIYKNISDKNSLNHIAVTSNYENQSNNNITSESDSENEYIDYPAMMSEVEEPTELRIVNESRPIGKKDVPSLVRVSCMPTVGSTQIEKNTHNALGIMFKSMKQDGVSDGLRVYSGYRSYSYQYTKYKSFLKSMKKDMGVKDADACEALAKQLFGKAGTSEHQLGTSVDLCIDKELNQNFLSTDAGSWLLENAHKYGFIFRYSVDKADIHKRTAEPWHLRYVGVTAAEKMYSENLCLEEYLEILK